MSRCHSRNIKAAITYPKSIWLDAVKKYSEHTQLFCEHRINPPPNNPDQSFTLCTSRDRLPRGSIQEAAFHNLWVFLSTQGEQAT